MKSNKQHPIKSLFEPKSFAVIGASHDSKKIGYAVVRNLLAGGYKGKIYPVSPKGGEISGIKVYPSIMDIKDEIDVASITIPAHLCVAAVKECAEKGVKNVQIITSGFSEIGNHADEDEITRIAQAQGMRVLGPNIFGTYSAKVSMNSTFSASTIVPGNVAIITQSGALGIAMIGKTAVENMGMSAIISTGNKCDISEIELLEYLIDQEETHVILMYIEGVENGDRLIPLMQKVGKIKPIVVIKSGRSKRGAMAAASHTGSLAGFDTIFDAVMRQCGVLRAESLDEAFNWCKFLAASPKPKGKHVVIVTNGGGIGVLAADACEKYGVDLYDNQGILHDTFGPATPSFGSTKNPVDITGAAMANDYDLALSASAASKNLDATIALYCETAIFDSDNLAPMIRDTYEKHVKQEKPITYAIVGGESVEKTLVTLKRENIPVYSDVYPAVSCLGAAYKYYNYQELPIDPPDFATINEQAINNLIDTVQKDGRNFLLAHEAQEVMRVAGISMPKSQVARNLTEAITAANDMGFPIVMKVVSRDIIHKSDAGGIALGLDNVDEVIDAYEAIMKNCKAYNPNAAITGVELAEMVTPGLELVVGAIRDGSFGPIVMCGLGGVYVEVMKDVSFRSYPLNHKEVHTMLQEIRSFPLLMGVRGEKKKYIEGVIDTIIKVGTILHYCPQITDIEINPLRVYEQQKGIKALDVRILLRKSGGK
ncbi:MAG: acetate--CoA ligase family protein [Bacteroidetes bacterium]|nr:acetate--CoA ligase family protein [Bacteroidota bacterium]